MKLPLLSAKELIAILEKPGFSEARQKGSHKYFKHPDGRATVVPVHGGRDIGRGLLRKIMGELGIKREEFLELHRNK